MIIDPIGDLLTRVRNAYLSRKIEVKLPYRDIKKSRNGHGIYIISTPKGVITWYEARSLNVWGELLCEVY